MKASGDIETRLVPDGPGYRISVRKNYSTGALFELAGTSSTDENFNFDRHWRNARTHTVHDPVRRKNHAIGDFHLNGKLPEPNGHF